MGDGYLTGNSSFFVLNRCMDDENNDTLSVIPQLEFKMNQQNFMSTISDVQNNTSSESKMILPDVGPTTNDESNTTTEDVEKRLSEILNENVTLKETLHQNNMAMKQQFNTLCLWQEEVLKVHQTHKERFDETKQLIVKLMAENKSLRLINEENMIQPDIKQLQADKEELQKRLDEALYNLNLMTSKVQRKRSQSVKEKELGSVIEMLTKRLEIAERGRRQLEIDLDKIMFQKSRLEQQLAQKDIPETCRERLVPSVGNKVLSDVFKKVNDFLNNSKRPASIEDISENESACLSISELTDKVKLLQESFSREKEFCNKTVELLKAALSEYQGTTKSLHEPSLDQTMSIETMTDKGSSESYDLLLAKVVSQDEELALRNEQLHNLRSRVEALESENEAIQILKAQVAVYHNDFNIERKNREKLVSERDRMLKEIQQLLQHNKQLIEENQRYQSCQCLHLKRPVENSSAIDTVQEKIGTGDLFCPNPECNMSFTTVGPLQVHVEKCLKLTD